MLYGKTNRGNLVNAAHALKELHYYCPLCQQKLTLKQGKYKCAHFAHRGLSCNYKDETYVHYQAKYAIGQRLKHLGFHVEIEPFLQQSKQIPDILVNSKLILEIQCSPITIKQLQLRTNTYESLGYKVIWIIEDTIKHGELVSLNVFQSACIVPNRYKLFLWNYKYQAMYCFKNITHIGGKFFIGKKTQVALTEIFNDDIVKIPNYKLSHCSITQFLMQCRKKHSVLEPNLSIMYNYKLNDAWVKHKLGFIFPEQIYLTTHPISWQLQLFKLLKENTYSLSIFKQNIKVRNFAYTNIRYEKYIANLVYQFKNQFVNFRSNDVQK